MHIYGIGIDVVDTTSAKKLIEKDIFSFFLEKWFTEDERYYILESGTEVEKFSVIYSIKESFIKASSGRVTLKNMKDISVFMYNSKYCIDYTKDSSFLHNKHCLVTVSQAQLLTISSVIIFLN